MSTPEAAVFTQAVVEVESSRSRSAVEVRNEGPDYIHKSKHFIPGRTRYFLAPSTASEATTAEAFGHRGICTSSLYLFPGLSSFLFAGGEPQKPKPWLPLADNCCGANKLYLWQVGWSIPPASSVFQQRVIPPILSGKRISSALP